MIVPETFRTSKTARTLWATMSYLSDLDPAGPIVKGAHDREITKRAIDRRRTLLEHEAADRFKAYFREERAHVVDAVRRGAVKVVRVNVGGSVWVPTLAKSGDPLLPLEDDLRETYESAWRQTAAGWGKWATERSPIVRKADRNIQGPTAYDFGAPIDTWLARNAGKRITGITEHTRKLIAKEIADGTARGETLRQIARRIDQFYLEDIIPNRSMVIARTEVGGATNWMQHFIAQRSADDGVPLEKEWLALHDHRTRLDHVDADGQRVEQDEPFVVGGDELMYPGDESLGAGADEIINCRCSVLYHVVDEAKSARPPSPAEFAKDVLGVQNDDVITALAFAKGVFGEGDEWTRSREILMKHVHRLRRAAPVRKVTAA